MPAKKRILSKSGGRTVYGPYKGSKEHHGRKTVVVYENGHTHSEDYARWKYENKHGALSKSQHVDHKNNKSKDDSDGNLQAMSAHDNIGKGNKENPR